MANSGSTFEKLMAQRQSQDKRKRDEEEQKKRFLIEEIYQNNKRAVSDVQRKFKDARTSKDEFVVKMVENNSSQNQPNLPLYPSQTTVINLNDIKLPSDLSSQESRSLGYSLASLIKDMCARHKVSFTNPDMLSEIQKTDVCILAPGKHDETDIHCTGDVSVDVVPVYSVNNPSSYLPRKHILAITINNDQTSVTVDQFSIESYTHDQQSSVWKQTERPLLQGKKAINLRSVSNKDAMEISDQHSELFKIIQHDQFTTVIFIECDVTAPLSSAQPYQAPSPHSSNNGYVTKSLGGNIEKSSMYSSPSYNDSAANPSIAVYSIAGEGSEIKDHHGTFVEAGLWRVKNIKMFAFNAMVLNVGKRQQIESSYIDFVGTVMKTRAEDLYKQTLQYRNHVLRDFFKDLESRCSFTGISNSNLFEHALLDMAKDDRAEAEKLEQCYWQNDDVRFSQENRQPIPKYFFQLKLHDLQLHPQTFVLRLNQIFKLDQNSDYCFKVFNENKKLFLIPVNPLVHHIGLIVEKIKEITSDPRSEYAYRRYCNQDLVAGNKPRENAANKLNTYLYQTIMQKCNIDIYRTNFLEILFLKMAGRFVDLVPVKSTGNCVFQAGEGYIGQASDAVLSIDFAYCQESDGKLYISDLISQSHFNEAKFANNSPYSSYFSSSRNLVISIQNLQGALFEQKLESVFLSLCRDHIRVVEGMRIASGRQNQKLEQAGKVFHEYAETISKTINAYSKHDVKLSSYMISLEELSGKLKNGDYEQIESAYIKNYQDKSELKKELINDIAMLKSFKDTFFKPVKKMLDAVNFKLLENDTSKKTVGHKK